MAYNISKYFGIPSNLKGAEKQIEEIIDGEHHGSQKAMLREVGGKYLCIKKQPFRTHSIKFYAYPIFVGNKRLKGAIKCKLVKQKWYEE